MGEEAIKALGGLIDDSILVFLGNRLRGDDAAGLLVGELLLASCATRRAIVCESQLELCLSELSGRLEKARRLIIIDAIEAGLEAGQIALAPLDEFSSSIDFSSSHGISMRLLSRVLKWRYGVEEAWVLGVQASELGAVRLEISSEVREGCEVLAEALLSSLPECRLGRGLGAFD